MKIFAERLKELRTGAKETQRTVAQKLKIRQQSYARYELGTGEPTLETLAEIAKLFGVTTDYLLGLSDY